MDLSAQRVVVTGGAGFIGSHLVDRLLAEDPEQVLVFDSFASGLRQNLAHHDGDPRLVVVDGDVRDAGAVELALKGADLVFHLAARRGKTPSDPAVDDLFSTNVLGSFNVLRTAADQGVGHVVFASSRAVYGEPITLPVDEDAPLVPVTTYGATKAAGEIFCRAFRREYGLTVSVLRLASTYGMRDQQGVVPGWLAQASAGQELRVYGGSQIIDFVWVGQVAEALLRAGTGGPMPPLNVASGTGTRVVDLARRVARLADCPGRLKVLPPRPGAVTRFVANVDRMRQLLQIEPPLDPFEWLDTVAPRRVRLATPSALPALVAV